MITMTSIQQNAHAQESPRLLEVCPQTWILNHDNTDVGETDKNILLDNVMLLIPSMLALQSI